MDGLKSRARLAEAGNSSSVLDEAKDGFKG